MKKYIIKFDEDYFLGCDDYGDFRIIDEWAEEDYKTAFDEAELVDYLTDQNPKAKINYEFVQKFIDVFGVEV